jgi:hypothetical protein
VRPAPLAATLLLATTGCASTKMLRLENELLQRQTAELHEQLEDCGRAGPRGDFAARVDVELIQTYIRRAGLPQGEITSPTAILVPFEAQNTQFGVFFQLFDEQKVLYIATHNYLRIEEAASSKAMVLLLTKVAILNYDLLLGKFQLNPNSGAISLSAEIHLNDGLGFETFQKVVANLIATADNSYPDLLRAAQGMGI